MTANPLDQSPYNPESLPDPIKGYRYLARDEDPVITDEVFDQKYSWSNLADLGYDPNEKPLPKRQDWTYRRATS